MILHAMGSGIRLPWASETECVTFVLILVSETYKLHLHLYLSLYLSMYVSIFLSFFLHLSIFLYTSTPQLPFKIHHIPTNRDHKALNRGRLGGLGDTSNTAQDDMAQDDCSSR